MVATCIMQYEGKIYKADMFRLHKVTRVTFEYFTFCRFWDYALLQAEHFEKVGRDILVTFPSSKNDQYHNGNTTLLHRKDTAFCPVRIMSIYFTRFGFLFGLEKGDNSFVHCMIRRVQGDRYADAKSGGAEQGEGGVGGQAQSNGAR